MNFLLSNAQNAESALIIAGAVIAGFFYFYGSFGKNKQELSQENMATAQNLIENYKQTIEVQNGKIKDLSTKEIDQGKQIAHLEGQVKVLTDMVALRDPATLEVFKAAPAIFEIARDNNLVARANGAAIEKLTQTLEIFLAKVNTQI